MPIEIAIRLRVALIQRVGEEVVTDVAQSGAPIFTRRSEVIVPVALSQPAVRLALNRDHAHPQCTQCPRGMPFGCVMLSSSKWLKTL